MNGPVAEVGPGRHLEGLEALGRRPGADVLQAPLREAGGEEPELHGATSCRSMSTQPPSRDDRSTASVMRTARAPSAKVGSPSTLALSPRVDGPQGVGDEGVEAVLVALRVAGRDGGVGRRGRVELVRVALDDLRRAAPPHPEGVGVLLVEGQRGAVGHDLEAQLVLVAGRDLAHHHRAAHPGDGAEQHQGHVLGGDRPPGPGAPAAARGREGGDVGIGVLALGHRGHELRAHRARGGRRSRTRRGRTSASRCRRRRGTGRTARHRRASCRPGRSTASPAGSSRGRGARRADRWPPGPAPRGPSGRSGRRTAPWRRCPPGRRRPRAAAAVAGAVASGFSHTTCLPGLEGGLGQRAVQVVGGADVDDVDVGGRRQLLGAEAALRAQPRHGLVGGVGRRRRHPHQAGAGPPQGAGVDLADEPGADHADAVRVRSGATRCGSPHGLHQATIFCRLSSRSTSASTQNPAASEIETQKWSVVH